MHGAVIDDLAYFLSRFFGERVLYTPLLGDEWTELANMGEKANHLAIPKNVLDFRLVRFDTRARQRRREIDSQCQISDYYTPAPVKIMGVCEKCLSIFFKFNLRPNL